MKITIDSYKNIHDLTIPVVNNKLILLGANGVGKTNTLEAVFYMNAGSKMLHTNMPEDSCCQWIC